MIIHGKNLCKTAEKRLTEAQLMLYDRAKKEGWFDQLKEGKNVSLAIGKNVGGLLNDFRKVFYYWYVGKEKSGKVWVYTIYAGDKELMKELHTPIRFEDPEKELMNYLNELKQ